MRKEFALAVVSLLAAAGSAFAAEDAPQTPPIEIPAENAGDEQAQELTQVVEALKAGRRQDVVELADRVISHFKTRYANEKRVLYSTGETVEALAYMAKSVNEHRDARVVSFAWAYAYMLKGYALVELGRPGEAREAIDAAIALAPLNPIFRAERGYLHQLDSHSAEALESYRLAEESARAAEPGETQKKQLGIALRGQGYALIELGRLDEAEALYRRCLDIDKEDKKAINEMLYIHQLRQQRGGASSPGGADGSARPDGSHSEPPGN